MNSMKVFFITTLLTFSQLALAKIEVGSPAPKVSGTTEAGATLNFEDLYKKGKVLVFFYPKAHTPGCTAQACSLRDSYAKLQDEGVSVLGVSTDNAETQKSFKEKNKLPFTLIADTDAKIAKAF